MRLDALIRKLDAVSTSGFLDSVKRRVAIDGLALVANEFRTSTDPYGVTWTGLKRPRPGGPVEDKTGAMKNSVVAYPTASGVRWSVTAPYAGYQHWGTKTNPQRRLLPVGFLGLPQAWADMVRSSFANAIRQAVRA